VRYSAFQSVSTKYKRYLRSLGKWGHTSPLRSGGCGARNSTPLKILGEKKPRLFTNGLHILSQVALRHFFGPGCFALVRFSNMKGVGRSPSKFFSLTLAAFVLTYVCTMGSQKSEPVRNTAHWNLWKQRGLQLLPSIAPWLSG